MLNVVNPIAGSHKALSPATQDDRDMCVDDSDQNADENASLHIIAVK